MVFNGKFKRIVITGLLCGLLSTVAAFAASSDTKAEMNSVNAELDGYSQVMGNAHQMAEYARALGESEDGVIIQTAKQYWHNANDEYVALYPSYIALNKQYNEELAAEKEAEEASHRRYIGQAKITAYTSHPSENGGYNVTATGMILSGNEWKIVAGDPSYWKYGTRFYIEGVGEVSMQDCGGAIKGSNRFDLLVPQGYANSWGIQYRDVWVIN